MPEQEQAQKEYTRQEFVQAFNELVERTGWTIVASPRYVATNHNSFELVVDLTVVKSKQ